MISGFRTGVLGGSLSWAVVAISVASAVALLAAGTSYFLQVERRFADVI
jgi:ABC-type polysaccharide/polyol phosphate export permease